MLIWSLQFWFWITELSWVLFKSNCNSLTAHSLFCLFLAVKTFLRLTFCKKCSCVGDHFEINKTGRWKKLQNYDKPFGGVSEQNCLWLFLWYHKERTRKLSINHILAGDTTAKQLLYEVAISETIAIAISTWHFQGEERRNLKDRIPIIRVSLRYRWDYRSLACFFVLYVFYQATLQVIDKKFFFHEEE